MGLKGLQLCLDTGSGATNILADYLDPRADSLFVPLVFLQTLPVAMYTLTQKMLAGTAKKLVYFRTMSWYIYHENITFKCHLSMLGNK